MTWKKIDPWHMRNGDWTMTKPSRPELYPLPYGLFHGGINHGYFKTSEAAIAAHTSALAGLSVMGTVTGRGA